MPGTSRRPKEESAASPDSKRRGSTVLTENRRGVFVGPPGERSVVTVLATVVAEFREQMVDVCLCRRHAGVSDAEGINLVAVPPNRLTTTGATSPVSVASPSAYAAAPAAL